MSKVIVTEVKTNFAPIWPFVDCNSSLNSQMANEMMHKASSGMEEIPYHFSGSFVLFEGHTGHKNWLSNPSNLPNFIKFSMA